MALRTKNRNPSRFCFSAITILCTLSCISLSGCIFPGVFRIDVAQGNIVTEQMVQRLQPGMTREQVLFVMGTPIIQDTLNPDRWDYLYSFSKAGKTPEIYRVTVYFQGDQFVRLEGQAPPAKQVF